MSPRARRLELLITGTLDTSHDTLPENKSKPTLLHTANGLVCVWCVCVWCSCAPFRARRQRRPLQAATKRRPPALVACGDGATSQSLERRCTDVHAHWLPTAATWSRTRLTARWHRSPRARHRITALVCPRPEHTKNGAACFRQTLHLPNCCSRAGAMWAGAMCSCCVRAIGTARALCREELPVPCHRLVDHGCAHGATKPPLRL